MPCTTVALLTLLIDIADIHILTCSDDTGLGGGSKRLLEGNALQPSSCPFPQHPSETEPCLFIFSRIPDGEFKSELKR